MVPCSPDLASRLPSPAFASGLRLAHTNLWMATTGKVPCCRAVVVLGVCVLTSADCDRWEHQVSITHFDAYENLLCVLAGEKTVTLYNPGQLPYMYPTEMQEYHTVLRGDNWNRMEVGVVVGEFHVTAAPANDVVVCALCRLYVATKRSRTSPLSTPWAPTWIDFRCSPGHTARR